MCLRCQPAILISFSLGDITGTHKQSDELERHTGPFHKSQDFFVGGKSLDLSKIGMNAIKVPHIGVLNEENAPVRESRHETGQAQKR